MYNVYTTRAVLPVSRQLAALHAVLDAEMSIAHPEKNDVTPMILRRVIAHVRKQEWTAIAIDLVIVVLGVVIGIQVSNWNAARVDRERAHGYLERIRDDLEADIDGYRDRLAFWSEVSASGARGLAYAETGDAGGATQWDLLRDYFWASQVGAFNLTEATYDELRSAVSWAFSATRACATSWRLIIRIQRF